uniref:Uncharacterized protein n=1 Tax=Anguilla anguilla TaxID=7936 RepID=A0A0E9V2J0_ANGAN
MFFLGATVTGGNGCCFKCAFGCI